MQKKAELIKPHFDSLAAGVHAALKEKGIEGIRVSEMHFVPAEASAAPPGMVWDCRPVPPGGVKCGWFPAS